MSRLPVIVGFGGINPAGRSSAHHAYKRMVIDQLDSNKADSTYQSLAALMNMTTVDKGAILSQTLIRQIEKNLFDPSAIRTNKTAQLSNNDGFSFKLKKSQLPGQIPADWHVTNLDDSSVIVTSSLPLDILFPDYRASRVNSAGQLPTGFFYIPRSPPGTRV